MKILICDDHKILRDGLRQILLQLPEEIVVVESGTGELTLQLLKETTFDIVILDISLPDRSGLEVLHLIKAKWPLTNVLMLSMLPQEQYAVRALKNGASGYLNKNTASEELLVAVKRISEGERYISQSLAVSLALNLNEKRHFKKHDILSGREFEIMIKIANGISLQDIGIDLFISDKTVSTYRSRILEKMGLTKNAELTRYCIEHNLI